MIGKSLNQTTITNSFGITTELISTSDIGKVTVTESVQTTTTTTTNTATMIRVTPSDDHREVIKTIEPKVVVNDNNQEAESSRETTPNGDTGNTLDVQSSPTQNSDCSKQNGTVSTVNETTTKPENKVIVIGSDGKQTPGLMNIQSVCPSTAKTGTTFVLLNKEGTQMKISLAPRKPPENVDKTEESKEEQENGQNGQPSK